MRSLRQCQCGARIDVYRTHPSAYRIRRVKRCVNCGQQIETVELSKDELDAMLKRLDALESILLPVAKNPYPLIVPMPGDSRI